MTEARSIGARVLDRTSRPDVTIKTEVRHIPANTAIYEEYTTRDGSPHTFPVDRAPEGGLTIIIEEKEAIPPRSVKGEGGLIQHWHRVVRKGPVEFVLPSDKALYVCIERKKGKQGGHWRGSGPSI